MTSSLMKMMTVAGWLLAGTVQAQSPVQSQAQAPRLALWIGEPLGVDSAKCLRAEAPADAAPFLTERDVVGWDAAHARWRLDNQRFGSKQTLFAMTDRCFVLKLDGATIRGATVSSYSARWLNFPTLAVARDRGGELSLRLSAMFNGADSPALETATLEQILGRDLNKQ